MSNIEQAEYKLTNKYSASSFSLPTQSLSDKITCNYLHLKMLYRSKRNTTLSVDKRYTVLKGAFFLPNSGKK